MAIHFSNHLHCMAKQIKEGQLVGFNGVSFSYDIRFDSSKDMDTLVVFCHGFKGFKDWGHWHLIADFFLEEGISFAKMNYSHNGIKGQETEVFNDLEGFAKNTYSAELYDLSVFLDHLITLSEDETVDFKYRNLHLIGHSRSGPIVLRSSIDHPSVRSVITWASVHSLSYMWERDEFDLENWLKSGQHHIMNGRTKQMMAVNAQLYKDFEKNKHLYSTNVIASKIDIPVLIVHGDSDPAVDVTSAIYLESQLKNATVHIVSEGDHVFGGRHPYTATKLPDQSIELCQTTIEFLKKG